MFEILYGLIGHVATFSYGKSRFVLCGIVTDIEEVVVGKRDPKVEYRLTVGHLTISRGDHILTHQPHDRTFCLKAPTDLIVSAQGGARFILPDKLEASLYRDLRVLA